MAGVKTTMAALRRVRSVELIMARAEAHRAGLDASAAQAEVARSVAVRAVLDRQAADSVAGRQDLAADQLNARRAVAEAQARSDVAAARFRDSMRQAVQAQRALEAVDGRLRAERRHEQAQKLARDLGEVLVANSGSGWSQDPVSVL